RNPGWSAHKGGLNAGDEVVFMNGLRFLKEEVEKLNTMVMLDQPYEFIITRLGKLERIEMTPIKTPRCLKEIAIIDRALAEKSFKF
ncbi:MAG: hypothetical protein H0V66_04755, partial [Bdellovibrionales bacterium]|nr:hypothetical protein [Bdellovibrionales bacterium]